MSYSKTYSKKTKLLQHEFLELKENEQNTIHQLNKLKDETKVVYKTYSKPIPLHIK